MGVVLLRPHDCLSFDRDNLIPGHMKSRRPRRLDPNYSIFSSETPISNPRSTRSEARKRSPQKGALKNRRTTTELVADPLATAAAAKNLVMGQVKILKRGETLNEAPTVAEDGNDRTASHGTASTPPKDPAGDRKVSKNLNGDRKVSATKKKSEKKKKGISISNRNPNRNPDDKVMKAEDAALSTTVRLGPDPEMVPKQTKNISELFFAGSGFVESPPPSSLPVPLFSRKKVLAAVKDDPTADILRMLRLNLS